MRWCWAAVRSALFAALALGAHGCRDVTLAETNPLRRTTAALLAAGAFGDLGWVERRPLAAGAQAFADLHAGRCAAPKIVLRP